MHGHIVCLGKGAPVLTISDSDTDVIIDWWIKELSLYDTDKAILESEDEDLTDSIINASQALLKAQFPSYDGFQSTLLGESLKFRPLSRAYNSVQILNTG